MAHLLNFCSKGRACGRGRKAPEVFNQRHHGTSAAGTHEAMRGTAILRHHNQVLVNRCAAQRLLHFAVNVAFETEIERKKKGPAWGPFCTTAPRILGRMR